MKRLPPFLLLASFFFLLISPLNAQEVDKKKKKDKSWEEKYQEYSQQKDSVQAAEFKRLDKELEKYYEYERDWMKQTLDIDRDEEIPPKATPRNLAGLENKKAGKYSIEERDAGERAKVAVEEITAEEFTPSLCPIDGDYRISSPFGWRTHPIYHKKLFHSGLDMAARKGTDVVAAASGTVIFSGRNGGYGKFLVIQHTDGLKTAYAHLSKIMVEKGDRVKKSRKIAEVGSTGRSTGAHLHYEVIINNKKTDPEAYFEH